MKIVIVGGHGRIGSRLTALLTQAGHDVVAASRRTGVDLVTGDGLAGALDGAAAVVDVTDSPSTEAAAALSFFTTATRRLLAAEAVAGVRHHVLLSTVAAGALPAGGYFQAKAWQEALVSASAIPHSILRTTLFFESVAAIADGATRGDVVNVQTARVQPVAADDVARTLARLVTGVPLNGTIELGGPESFYVNALIERVLGARRDPRRVVANRHTPLFGVTVGERTLVAGDEAELGAIPFDEWLQRGGAAGDCRAAAPAGPWRTAAVPFGSCEFAVADVPPGSVLRVGDVAVFSVEGGFCATQALCTHRGGTLSEGTVDGSTVTCPLHGARFNVWTGAVLRGPAAAPLRTYAVTVDGGVGRVEGIPVDAAAVATR